MYNLLIIHKESGQSFSLQISNPLESLARLPAVQAGVIEAGIRWFSIGLEPEVALRFKKMILAAQAGEKIVVSTLTPLLDGYYLDTTGGENLPNQRGTIIYMNHYHGGPLRGFWNIIGANKEVKKVQGKEVRWVQAPTQNQLTRPFVEPIHKTISQATNGIYIEDGQEHQATQEIWRELENAGIVGITPEAEPSRELIRARPGSGRLFTFAAFNNRPIIPIATWSDNRILHVVIGEQLDLDTVMSRNRAEKAEVKEKDQRGQAVVNYAMEQLAKYLPPQYRGHYA